MKAPKKQRVGVVERYQEFLPVTERTMPCIISLNEGDTPLILSEFVDPDGREYFAVCNNSQTDSCMATLAYRGKPTIYKASGTGESPAKSKVKGDITGTLSWLAPGQIDFYRIDYDEGATTSWDWARVGPSFHDFKNFGNLLFE